MDQYEAYVKKCKTPKKAVLVKAIVSEILDAMRQGVTTKLLVSRLNGKGILTIMGKPWTYYSLQMQLLKMARLEPDSSLAWGLTMLLVEGKATRDDLYSLECRTRLPWDYKNPAEIDWQDDVISEVVI